MNHDIEAIFLDVGNTLRIVLDDPPFRAQACADLMALVGAREPEDEFFAALEARWNAYRKASKKSLVEASERDLWTVHADATQAAILASAKSEQASSPTNMGLDSRALRP